MINKLRLKPDQALPKIKHYCAYQERSHAEVKEKLYSYGLFKKDVEEVIALLIEENFLNEERFASQFAGGHFRTKKWGRVKITYALKQKKVSPYCIKIALKQIDEETYLKTLNQLFNDKLKSLRGEKNIFIKKRKLQDFLLQKGYERGLISNLVNEF